MTCQHENVHVVACVSRTIHGDRPALLIQALCEDCRAPFQFKDRPGISTDLSTLCAPIEPAPVTTVDVSAEEWTPDP